MEYFSELYSYHFSKLINIESAVYEMDNGYIRTKNFSKNTNFEPLASIAGANDDYDFVFNLLISLNQDIAKDYLKLIEEYELNYESYTQEEKDAINRAIGRYNGLLIKQGIEEAGSVIQELGERLPSLIEGFMSAFETDDNKR
jgi:hypothetical protein